MAIMVIILVFRVFTVVQPETGSDKPLIPAARSQLPPEVKPPLPPPTIPIDREAQRRDWRSLWEQNPLSWKEPGKEAARDDDGDNRSRKPKDLEVLRITKGRGGAYRAQIKTGSSRKWLSEGQSFERYELRSIDPDSKCCEIRDTSIQRVVTVCIEGDD